MSSVFILKYPIEDTTNNQYPKYPTKPITFAY